MGACLNRSSTVISILLFMCQALPHARVCLGPRGPSDRVMSIVTGFFVHVANPLVWALSFSFHISVRRDLREPKLDRQACAPA
ncbi:hypothetical protein EV363DRAFT_244574 [Boletus edulis]|nr:hypothetical protein EV363DRAFT_244574 [Boletus edulis]